MSLGTIGSAQTKSQPAQPATSPPAKAPAQASGEQLKQVLSAKDPAAQARLVRGLRALKDPALGPLFAQMGNSKTAQLRAEAILGLAELEQAKNPAAGGGLDLLPVRKLDPITQAYVLSEAIEKGLVKTEQLEDLARWTDLQPGLYVSVVGRLVAAKKKIDPARLRQVATGEDPIVSVVAAILLTQMGASNKDIAATASGEKLLASKEKNASDASRRVLSVIRERKLAAGAAFAQKAVERSVGDRLLHFEAVGTLLVVEPSGERAAQLLGAEMKAAPDLAERTRLALAAVSAVLDRDAGLPASALNLLKKDTDPLISALGEAAEAAVSKTNAGPAFTNLLAKRSGPALQWTLHAADRLPAEEAKAVRLAIVSAALTGDDRAVEAAAADAAHALAGSDPMLLAGPLKVALEKRDDKTAGRILAAAFRSDNPKAAELATVGHSMLDKDKPGLAWPSPPVEAIAALLEGRYAGTFTQGQIEQLTRIASGAGGLPETSKVQAAWIALKGSTNDKTALAKILTQLAP